jgi:hypothetical protein
MKTKYTLSAFILLTGIIACSPDRGEPITGGKGGNTTLNITPVAGNKILSNSMVYIEYAATNAPKDGIYDDSARSVMIDTLPVATFTNLKTGTYYLFITGYDTTRSPSYFEGGIMYRIEKEGTYRFLAPVPTL